MILSIKKANDKMANDIKKMSNQFIVLELDYRLTFRPLSLLGQITAMSSHFSVVRRPESIRCPIR